MLDKFDYMEPECPLCGGGDFYHPEKNRPLDRIPVGRIIEKLDRLFDRNDMSEARRLLEYWKDEAHALLDRQGELSMSGELIGLYRKIGAGEKCLCEADAALELLHMLGQENTVTGGTTYINCATAYKAFGKSHDALPLYRKAENIYKRELDPNDTRMGGLYNNMALALADTGDISGAEDAYRSALEVMRRAQHGELECAITLINMAHMYERCLRLEMTDGLMCEAYELLRTEALPRDGYYAFVCEKCYPSFEYFGYTEISDELKKISGEIYARS